MAANPSLIGQTVGQYKILSELGRGGMGFVYLANQESVDRQVALKILATDLVEDESFVKRFVQEGRTAASLTHPNIVTIHEIGREGDRCFIAMEALQGKPISALLQESGNLSVAKALDIARQAAEALSSAHEKGVIHRDIKPENIMIDRSGHVKLMDFGLAKPIASAGNLTEAGTFVGTPKYMSLEQFQSDSLGPQSDIYSLGVVLYEMLCGQPPYDSETTIGIIVKVALEPFPKLPGVDVSTPASVERIVRNMTARSQENRYASARALVKDLEACLKDPKAPIQSTWIDEEEEGTSRGLGQDLVAGLTGEARESTDSEAVATPLSPKRNLISGLRPLRALGIAVAVLALTAGTIFAIPRIGGARAEIGSELSEVGTPNGVVPDLEDNRSQGQETFARDAVDAASVDFGSWISRDTTIEGYENLADGTASYPFITLRFESGPLLTGGTEQESTRIVVDLVDSAHQYEITPDGKVLTLTLDLQPALDKHASFQSSGLSQFAVSATRDGQLRGEALLTDRSQAVTENFSAATQSIENADVAVLDADRPDLDESTISLERLDQAITALRDS